MSLTPEWRGRIERWRDTLRNQLLYVELGTVPMEGFVTAEQLTPEQAARGAFKPMPVGTEWGAKWQYAWFRGRIVLPEEAKGETIVLRPDPAAESRVLINGVEAGGSDHFHHEFLLAAKGRPGTAFDVLVEAYAGHGATNCGGGPCPHGELTVPEPPPTQRRVTPTRFGIWNEDVFQLWLDVQTLLELRDLLDPDSLRVAELDAGLKDFTLIADLELPRAPMLDSVRKARARLKPLLAARNGSTAPLLYCFGHSHIDVAWLWPLAETERKVARTFATQLALMDQYPEYVFLQSQPHLYQMTKTLYPKLYARIKAAVAAGQWIADGGMWVEADTNITGGESLIRQFIHGKRFLKDEFGVDSRLMWLPDVFGYSGALPQIMAGCGIQYFSTAKIFWNYEGGELFPHNTFWWEGIDGTRILSHFLNDYNSQTNPKSTIPRWRDRVQKDGIDSRLMPFGWGDGGGGPTREHLEYLRRQENLEGAPRTRQASPIEYFRREERRHAALPVYVGEHYFQAHRGTYTSQALTKLGNRRSEFGLREAELWGVAAAALTGYTYPLARADRLWKTVLLNQFHDIIPGSSIRRVYEEAETGYAEVIDGARAIADAAAARLLKRKADAVTVFNSLSWDRRALIELPAGFKGLRNEEGRNLPTQAIDGTLYAAVENLPACGWSTFYKADAATPAEAVSATPTRLENSRLRLTFNATGEITGILDKETGRELAAGHCNVLRLFKDVPNSFDAWDINSMYRLSPVELSAEATVEAVNAGPLVGILRIRRMINQSELIQEVRLEAGSSRVDFVTTVDWQESHKLLKASFPVCVRNTEAIHEIQFGHLRRPTHASRPFDADRFEVCNHKWTALTEENRGVALLNDSKYGIDVGENVMNLTLLKSALAPDMLADKGLQRFTYSFYCWNGSFADSRVVQEAYELNAPVVARPGSAGRQSLFQVSAANVIIETVKPAEDGSGDVIVRLYEAKRMATDCVLSTALPLRKARITNMLETKGTSISCRDGLALSFRPFEIKTLRLTCRPAK